MMDFTVKTKGLLLVFMNVDSHNYIYFVTVFVKVNDIIFPWSRERFATVI